MTAEGWARISGALADHEYRRALTFLTRKIPLVAMERVLLMRGSTREPLPLLRRLKERAERMDARLAEPGELAMLKERFPHHADRYERCFRSGDTCLVVEAAERIPIAMGWVCTDATRLVREQGCLLRLPPDGCWGYDTFIVEQYRRRGAFVVLMEAMLSRLAAQGHEVIYASVAWENGPSRRAHTRIGYTEAVTLDRYSLLGLSSWRVRKEAERAEWLFRPGRNPFPLP